MVEKGGRKAIEASLQQERMIQLHVDRLIEALPRWAEGSFFRLYKELELERWQLAYSIVSNNLVGKTVAPS